MPRIVRWSLLTVVFMMALVGVGCGADEEKPSVDVAPQLPADRAEAIEFWWDQGQGERGQHLLLGRGAEGGAQLTVFELDLGGSWRRLFEPPPASLPVTQLDRVRNDAVNRQVREMIATRLTDELGGRAGFERQVAPALDTGDSEPLDALVLGSVLMVVPSTLAVRQA